MKFCKNQLGGCLVGWELEGRLVGRWVGQIPGRILERGRAGQNEWGRLVGGHNPHDPPCQALVSPKASHVGMLTTTSEGWERESVGWLFWKCDLDISRPHMWGFKTSQRRGNNFIALVPRLVRSRP